MEPEIDGLAEQGISIDDQIAATRANTSLSNDMIGQRLEQLYRQKFPEGGKNLSAGASQPALPSGGETVESLDEKIQAVRNDAALSGDRKGEKLLDLYQRRGSIIEKAKEAEAATHRQSAAR